MRFYIEPSHDPFWPFSFDEYSSFPGERDTSGGQHQYALVSRLNLPNLVEDEGILLISLRDTIVDEWIQDARYREIMQSMITVADVGGPQEFILGGAAVQLEDFERFIPRGMVEWFRRRILEKWSRTATPEGNDEESRSSSEKNGEEEIAPPSSSMNGTLEDNMLARLRRAIEVPGDEPFPPSPIATPPDSDSP